MLDGSASQAASFSACIWTCTMGSNDAAPHRAAPNAVSSPQCEQAARSISTATGGDGPNGERYLKMTVTLQVRDGSSILSDIVRAGR